MSAGPERRYRRLLWAYPGAYRRRHGAEIVTTLLDMAESGHGGPTVAQRLHLVACGLRQRFRLPARRPLALVAAVLAAMAVGALGAAGGTWLGWRTAASVPSTHDMRALTGALAGAPPEINVYELATAMNGPWIASTATGRVPYSADRVRTALTSAGWRITAFTETTGGTVVDITTDPWTEAPTRLIRFSATKDGLSLTGDTMTVVGPAGDSRQRLDVWVDETAAVRPLTIAGLLIGMLAGWPIAAALAYRAGLSGRPRRAAVTVLGMMALAAAAVPVFELYRNLYQVLSYDSGAPGPYVVNVPGEAGLVPAGVGIGLLALTAAFLIAARGREPVVSD